MNRLLDVVEKVLGRAKTSSDVVLAVVMAMIIGAMIVPLPEWALDLGLAINLAASLSLLVAALYARDALKVASFPTLLLITTLFRLAMNVSSTRLALSEGHAGEIIQAFGEFVVRGDYVVGAVIFAILTLVQFLVVTKGAERVAEVSARFTLDAMPGKQMSIDADLRAGAITQDQARARRRALERESQLFGSMDGAMKFVKGDVIAGLVITFINLLGGIVIGVLQNGMTAAEAAGTYALIAIGDGLVSQIPSLAIAVAAGIVVTRVASEKEEDSLGTDIGAQFFGQHKALFVVAGLCGAFALMPGMPHLTFLIISALAVLVGLGLKRLQTRPVTQPAANKPKATPSPDKVAPHQPSRLEEQVQAVTPLVLDLAADLTELVQEDDQAFVHVDLNTVRERLFFELGIRVPPFRVRTGAPLAARSYQLSVDEVPAGRGQLPEAPLVVLQSEADVRAQGFEGPTVTDPLGRQVVALTADREAVQQKGLTVRSSRELLVEHLVALLRKRAAHFIGVQELAASISTLETQAPALVKEALQKVPLPLLTEVLKKLLQEQVGIRNLRIILEALVSPATEGDANQLAERCRAALSRQISHQFAPNGPLFAWLVDPAIEDKLRQGGMALEPADAQSIIEGARRAAKGGRGILLASPDVRRLLRRLLEGPLPELAVLTFSELDPELQVRPVGRIVAQRA